MVALPPGPGGFEQLNVIDIKTDKQTSFKDDLNLSIVISIC
jgi:hypothetical protein